MRLTAAAAFSPRQSFSLLVTAEGVLLLVAGLDMLQPLNTLYASFDGGYTWHGYKPRNSADAFAARHGHVAALDQNGTLYIAGGLSQTQHYITDIIMSSVSMSNLTAMQEVFGVEIGGCGVGLYCMDDNVMMRDGRVYCARCTANDAINTTVFIVVIVAVVLAFAAFIVWRNCLVKAKAEHPVGLNEHLVNAEEEDE